MAKFDPSIFRTLLKEKIENAKTKDERAYYIALLEKFNESETKPKSKGKGGWLKTLLAHYARRSFFEWIEEWFNT